jgi:integrase/recombinase XerD
LDEVTRSVVAEYVADFAAGPGRVTGDGRAPRTVNHRVAALAAFFGSSSGIPGARLAFGEIARTRCRPPVGRATVWRVGIFHAGADWRCGEVSLVCCLAICTAVAERLAAVPKSVRDRAILTLLLQ